MSSQQVQQIIDALNHAAGTGWEALVRQQFLNGIAELIVTAAFLLIGLIAIKPMLIGIRNARREYDRRDYVTHDYSGRETGHYRNPNWYYWNFLSMPAGALIVTAVFVLLFCGPDAANHLINPQGFAIQQLPGFPH